VYGRQDELGQLKQQKIKKVREPSLCISLHIWIWLW